MNGNHSHGYRERRGGTRIVHRVRNRDARDERILVEKRIAFQRKFVYRSSGRQALTNDDGNPNVAARTENFQRERERNDEQRNGKFRYRYRVRRPSGIRNHAVALKYGDRIGNVNRTLDNGKRIDRRHRLQVPR